MDLERVTATPVPCHDGLGQVVRPLLYGLARQMAHLESCGTPRLADHVVGLIGTLLAEQAGADRSTEEDGPGVLTQRLLAYMEERLADPGLSPEGIAAAHRISRRYLYKLLAAQGHTLSGWIREQRLDRCGASSPIRPWTTFRSAPSADAGALPTRPTSATPSRRPTA
ncbi:helix-turn-helix domain-containing protein [Streptomyces cellulosae]|uniref:hypothetical protein n=1 Tax=Streptomyces cellulosae TaxID=1968 RepID=UPI00131D1CA7|nr:hypothetical protein [Streptomyces cellulosae]